MHRRSLALLVCVLSLAAVAPAAASAAPTWAPADTATIRPGVMTYTDGAPVHGQLHVLRREQRLHRPGRPLLRHGRGHRDRRLRLRLAADRHAGRGRRRLQPGTLVYNSWLTMQARGETDPDTCAYNDFALVQLDAADHGKVNPSGPGLGRPDRPRRHDRPARQGLLVRQLDPARRRRAAEPEGGLQPRRRRAAAGPTPSTR